MKPLYDYQKVRALTGFFLRNRSFQARRAALRERFYLQVGSGPHNPPGFVNLDYRWVPGVDVVWDLTHPLPFPNDRFRGLYSEHCLEHFDEIGLLEVLAELKRVLAPGGRVRIVVPSLELHVRAYLDGLAALHVPDRTAAAAPARGINRVFYSGHHQMGRSKWVNDGHHFIHDFNSFAVCLETVGFCEIQQAAFGQGSDPMLIIDQQERAWESLYVEAVKPLA